MLPESWQRSAALHPPDKWAPGVRGAGARAPPEPGRRACPAASPGPRGFSPAQRHQHAGGAFPLEVKEPPKDEGNPPERKAVAQEIKHPPR